MHQFSLQLSFEFMETRSLCSLKSVSISSECLLLANTPWNALLVCALKCTIKAKL